MIVMARASSIRFSASFGLAFIVLTYFLFVVLGAFYPLDTAKQAFLVSLALFLVLAVGIKLSALFKFSAGGQAELANAVFLDEEIYISLSLLPYIAICLSKSSPEIAIFYVALLLLCISFCASVKITPAFLTAFSAILISVILMHGLIYFGQGMPGFFQSVFPQKNSFALNMLAAFFSAAFVFSLSTDVSTRITSIFCMAACLVLVLASHSRGTLLDIVVFAGMRLCWPFISRTKFRYWSTIAFFLLSGILLVPLYVLLSFTAFGSSLNYTFTHYTGIGLFSGRNFVWPAYIYLISMRPMLGYGFGDTMGMLLRMAGLPPDYLGLSAHNLYLMTASQIGVLGVATLLFFFGTVWGCLFRSRHSKAGAIAGSIFITMLVNEMFEVSFTQVNMYVILMVWCLIGFGIQSRLEVVTESRPELGSEHVHA